MADEEMSDPFGFQFDTMRLLAPGFRLERDQLIIEELVRSAVRFAFRVEVGDVPSALAVDYLRRVRQQFRNRST